MLPAMRLSVCFTLLLLAATASGQVEVLVETIQIIKLGREIITEILKTWQLLDGTELELPSTSFRDKEKLILQKIDTLTKKVDDVADLSFVTLSTVQRMLNDLPKLLLWRRKMETLSDRLQYIFYMDNTMASYIKHRDVLEQHTLEDFAQSVISHGATSVRGSLQKIHALVVPNTIETGIFSHLTNTFQVSIHFASNIFL